MNNLPDDHKRVCEQYFLCTDHLNFLESIRDDKQVEKEEINNAEENEEINSAEENEEINDAEQNEEINNAEENEERISAEQNEADDEERNSAEQNEDDDDDDNEEETSAPDQLSQQLSTLSVSQPLNEDPDDDDPEEIIEIVEVDNSQEFFELTNCCSQNLDSIFPPLPDIYVCRLCGKSTDGYIQIFSENNEGNDISLLEKMRYYLPIKLDEDDTLPKVICGECNELLDKSHDLAMTSLATEALLTHSTDDEFMNKNEIGSRDVAAVDDHQITSTQGECCKIEGDCSQETVSDVVRFECSQSSLITSDEDEGPFTTFEGLKHLRTYGKKRPMIHDGQDESVSKRRREEPVFEKW